MPSYNHYSGKYARPRSRKNSTKYTQKVVPIRRTAVKNANASLHKLLRGFNVPAVQKTFGTQIVRVCCRTVVQLENISLIMKELLISDLIQEVGMPLQYSYKMKTLVLFIKPVNVESTIRLNHVFRECSFKYNHDVIVVGYPTAPTNKIFKKNRNKANVENTGMEMMEHVCANNTQNEEANSMENCTGNCINCLRVAQNKKNKNLIMNVCNITIHFVVLSIILMLIKIESSTV